MGSQRWKGSKGWRILHEADEIQETSKKWGKQLWLDGNDDLGTKLWPGLCLRDEGIRVEMIKRSMGQVCINSNERARGE